jgi:hypothetical protein
MSRVLRNSKIIIRPKVINTVIFDLHDTIIFPKKKYNPVMVQTFMDTFKHIGYKNYDSSAFISLVYKHMGNPDDVHLKKVLKDPLVNYKNINYNYVYNLFVSHQYALFRNSNYIRLDPTYNETICILKEMGVSNFIGISNSCQGMTSLLVKEIKYQGFDTGTILNCNTNYNEIIKYYDTRPDKCIKVSSTIKSAIDATKSNIYSVGLTTKVEPMEFILCGSNHIIHHFRQLPYVISRFESNL